MGDPVKIIDIINSIVDERNSQLNGVGEKVKVREIGIRPGKIT